MGLIEPGLSARSVCLVSDEHNSKSAVLQAGAVNALDAGTLRALAEAVLNGAASSQQDGQAAELARSILHQPNAVTNALVNQLAHLQMQQNQQLNLQQQVRMLSHHAYDTFCNMTYHEH